MSLKNHYVALVVTKSNTKPDSFCKEHQLELSLGGNHFSSCKSPIFGQDSTQEECIPVGCVPPTAAAVQSAPGGGVSTRHPPDQAPPWEQTPLDQGPLRPATPQEQAPHPRSRPARPGTPPLWTEFLMHASENITLPQTSFAGDKK